MHVFFLLCSALNSQGRHSVIIFVSVLCGGGGAGVLLCSIVSINLFTLFTISDVRMIKRMVKTNTFQCKEK